MKKSSEDWKIIYTHCAGIDVGSRFHMVAIGQMDLDVQKFGVNTIDHGVMID